MQYDSAFSVSVYYVSIISSAKRVVFSLAYREYSAEKEVDQKQVICW